MADGGYCDIAPGLIPVEEARQRALALARPPGKAEALALARAIGRILAQPLCARADAPGFDAVAMDGYALASATLSGPGPWILPLDGRSAAGDAPAALTPGHARRVLTGAPLPAGADTVVMQEHVTAVGAGIALRARPRPGENIRPRGSDMRAGATLLAPGREIGPREAAIAAAAGAAHLAVHPRLQVALVSTGSELRAPGAALKPGQIWNVNATMLAAELRHGWCARPLLRTVRDTRAGLARALARLAPGRDLVITTGGASVGDEDHLADAIRAAGGQCETLRLAMKPGKPLVLGRIGGVPVLGLPGNPVAAFVAWQVIGRPLAHALAGRAMPERQQVWGRLDAPLRRKPGRREYRPARIVGHGLDGLPVLELGPADFSARVSVLACCDGLAVLPEDTRELPAGEELAFLPFA